MNEPPAAAPTPPPAPPKPKRWKKIALIAGGSILGLIVLVLVIGPFIIGAVARSRIESIVAEKLQAKVAVGGVSFGWNGHIVIDEVRVVPKNFSEPLFEVKKVDVRVDLAAAIGGRYMAAVEVVAPKVLVEKGADGKFNYEMPPAPASPPETKKEGDGKTPFVQAALTVRDGEVRIRGRGRETVYQNLAVRAKVDTLEKPVDYDLSLESPMKDALKVKGSIDLRTVSGPATLTLDRVSLKNLTGAARAYSDVLELDGTVSGSFNYELKGAPRFVGKGGLEIDGFVMLLHERSLRLDKLTISHDGGIDEKGSGRHVISLACGKAIGATLTVDVADAFGARLVKTDLKADTDLAALADVLAKVGALPKGLSLAGSVRVRGACDSKGPTQADLDAGKLRLAARVDVDVVGSALDIVADGKPIQLDGFTVHHTGTLDEGGSGKNTVMLSLGKALGASIQADVTDALGKTPLVRCDLKADSDLGELGRMLEKLIGLKQDLALAGTAALRGSIHAKGAESVKADIDLGTSDLVAIDQKSRKRHEIDKSITAKLVGGWDGKTKTGIIDVLTLHSSFATMNGRGGASVSGENPEIRDTSLTLEADLEKLGLKLASFMEKPPALGGGVTLRGSAQGEKIGVTGQLKALRYEKYGPLDATVVQKGTFSMAKDGALEIEAATLASTGLDVTISGGIRKVMEESREGELRLDAVARPAELSKWVPDLGMGGAEIKLTSTVSIRPKLITVAGQTKLDGLALKSKDAKGVEGTKTAKTGPIDFNVQMKDPDILATLKAESFEWIDKGYAAKGAAESQVSYSTQGTTGTTKLSNLEIVDDRRNVVKDPGLTIIHDIGLADNNKTMDLRKVELTSTFLRGTLTGKLLHVDKAPEFQKLRAGLKYHPERLTAFAKPWLPGKLEGAEEKAFEFTLDGKAASAELLSILRGTRGALDLDLATFVLNDNGLTLSGKSRVDLKDGTLTSTTPLVVNKGKTELNASLDFNAAEKNPRSAFTFAAKDVDANGQMGPLLERINPIFHTSGVDARVDGVIQSDFKLDWTGLIDPDEKDWVAASTKALSGGGVLGVRNLNIAGSPTAGQIMAALGQGNALQGELAETRIRIGNGRCEYDNMTLRGSRKPAEILKRDQEALEQERAQLEAGRAEMTPKELQKRQEELRMKEEDLPYRYVLRFSGYVRFDKRMELRVLMPMTPGLVKSHPNLQKYIGTSFWVDLQGTTDSPSLDTKKMISELLQRAAEGIVKDKIDDALKGLFGRQREKDADKVLDRASKVEAAGNAAEALRLYEGLLKDYADTDYVKKRKASIQERVRALGGK